MEIKIGLYNNSQDKAGIKAILQGSGYYTKIFNEVEENYKDYIYVARYNDSISGYLSFEGGYVGRYTTTTIFVGDAFRNKGIGTALMNLSDKILSKHEAVERSECVCLDGDDVSIDFVKKHGYQYYFSEYLMERKGDFLPLDNIKVRHYKDEDFLQWHYIQETAFFLLRERIGIKPPFYYAINQGGYNRESYMSNQDNYYVMLVDNNIVAVGKIQGNELKLVAVRPDLQSRGYGKAFVPYLVNEIMHRGEKTVALCVVKGNYAKKLYESLGFKEKQLIHHYHKLYRPDSRLISLPDEYLKALHKSNF